MKLFSMRPFLSAIGALILLAGCDQKENAITSSEMMRLPEVVRNDFYARFPDARDPKPWNGEDLIRISFKDKSDNSVLVAYRHNVWELTATELNKETFLLQLPSPVRRAYAALEITENADYPSGNEYIYRLERRGISHVGYHFHFLKKDEAAGDDRTFWICNVLINADGRVLEASHFNRNRPVFFMGFDSALAFIRDRYPEADIRGCVNDSGDQMFFVLHQGKMTRVWFRSMSSSSVWEWDRSMTRLEEGAALPEPACSAIEKFKQEHPDLHYMAVYYRETPTGNAYALQYGNEDENTITFFPEQ
ncbi:MAG: hypothetical protein ACOX5T_00795 [Candidatus Cryptobacteroides sp.]|jgi:hypothetical protein